MRFRTVAPYFGRFYGRILGIVAGLATHMCDGLTMRRVIVIAAAAAALGGCSSFSSFSLDSFTPTPPPVQVQLESNPPGAEAKTSLGPGCKTPCSVSVPVPENSFSVTYALARYEPATVQVQVIRNPGDMASPATTITDPNPVFAELRLAPPPPKAVRKPMRPKKPKAPKSAAAPANATFPDPGAPPPPASPSR